MQSDLKEAYRRILSSALVPPAFAQRLSCPLLLSVDERWVTAAHRVLFVGQETLGWSWDRGNYYAWPHPRLNSFADFLSYGGSIDALIYAYSEFAFAKMQPEHRRSPFWRAFRELLAEVRRREPRSEILWTNLFKCSLDDGSLVYRASRNEIDQALQNQRGLLVEELNVLKPTIVVFVTGPYYDDTIAREISGATLVPIGDRPLRQFCRVQHEVLPTSTFRTYHPNYLARTPERRQWLKEIAKLAMDL
jgi:hypothetical protein